MYLVKVWSETVSDERDKGKKVDIVKWIYECIYNIYMSTTYISPFVKYPIDINVSLECQEAWKDCVLIRNENYFFSFWVFIDVVI